MIRFEIAARAVCASEAAALGLNEKKTPKYIEDNWRDRHPLIVASYEREHPNG